MDDTNPQPSGKRFTNLLWDVSGDFTLSLEAYVLQLKLGHWKMVFEEDCFWSVVTFCLVM